MQRRDIIKNALFGTTGLVLSSLFSTNILKQMAQLKPEQKLKVITKISSHEPLIDGKEFVLDRYLNGKEYIRQTEALTSQGLILQKHMNLSKDQRSIVIETVWTSTRHMQKFEEQPMVKEFLAKIHAAGFEFQQDCFII